MKKAPLPPLETERLEALREVGVMNHACEECFDTLVEVAQKLFDVPMAFISFLGADKQLFKARVGLDVAETPRVLSFCSHAILESRPMVIEDALRDERFWDNPLVAGDPKIRFYVGAQIRTFDGHCIGTLCVCDNQPRKATKDQVRQLELLARLANQLLEPRRLAERTYIRLAG